MERTALQHLRLFGDYTYQHTEDTSATFSRGTQLPGRPRHELHQGLEIFAPQGKFVYELDYIAQNFLDRANVFLVDSRLLHNLSATVLPLGGDITDFEIVSSTKGFAIVTDANFANSLMTFNPATGQRLSTVLGPLNVSISQLAINSRNELYVAVNDSTATTPGVRVFDTVTDRDLIPGPLNVGQLPPIWVLFLE